MDYGVIQVAPKSGFARCDYKRSFGRVADDLPTVTVLVPPLQSRIVAPKPNLQGLCEPRIVSRLDNIMRIERNEFTLGPVSRPSHVILAPSRYDLRHRHLIACERSRFIGTNHCYGAKRFHTA